MIEKQQQLEDMYNRNQQIPKLHALLEESGVLEDYKVNPEFHKWLTNFMVHMMIHKRMDIAAALGISRMRLELGLVATYLELAVEAGLVLLEDKVLITAFNPDDTTQQEMALYMFPPPMVIPPKELVHNSQTGYHFYDHGSAVLKADTTDDDICLDVLNKLNKLELSINHKVLNNVSSLYKSLRSRKAGESLYDFNKRKRQWLRFDTETRVLIESLSEISDTFYMSHAYDKRGRLYCRGYHLNYQGTDWNKAVVEFANKELIHES